MKFKDVSVARENYKRKVTKCACISLAVAAAIALIITLSNGSGSVLGISLVFTASMIFVFAFIFIISLFFSRNESKKYRSAYKAYFVEKNLAKTFTDLKYNHEAGLAKEVLSSTGMVNTGDVYSSNDLTTGRYKDVAFTQADVHIQEQHTDSDGNTTYVTIFKGRFMIFEFPKKFNFRIEVAEKWFGANRVPKKDTKTGRKFEKIEVESSEFNKTFKIYTQDGFETFYLLDPAFIQNILTLKQQYNGKLLLCFIDNKLTVGLKDGKDAFEAPGLFSKLDEATEDEKVTREIRLVTNFVDQLKLSRKLFK